MISTGAPAPFARSASPRRSKLVGSARRSGPMIQARSAVSGTGAASPREWDPSARRPYHLFSRGAAAPFARSASPRRSQLVGSARRSGPMLQACSAVSGTGAASRESRTPTARRPFRFRGALPRHASKKRGERSPRPLSGAPYYRLFEKFHRPSGALFESTPRGRVVVHPSLIE